MHNQLDYSGCTMFQNCPHLNHYTSLNFIEEINKYLDLGFTHFKIETPPPIELNNFNNYLIENLILPEN